MIAVLRLIRVLEAVEGYAEAIKMTRDLVTESMYLMVPNGLEQAIKCLN